MTTMDAIALKALRESIAHWERNVAAEMPEDVSVSGEDCALCNAFVFANRGDSSDCEGCPVMEWMGQADCQGTPYYRAREAFFAWRTNTTPATRDAWRVAAQEMLDFLKELLPEEAANG